MKRAFFIVLLFFYGFHDVLNAQTSYAQTLENHLQRFEHENFLPDQTVEQIQEIKTWITANTENIASEYFDLLDKYLNYLSKNTYKPYTSRTHEDILSQALNILKASSDSTIDMKSWMYSLLPEYYAAVKTLIPLNDSRNATVRMAVERPQELIGQYSRLLYSTDEGADLQIAILLSPHSVTQFMHYNNRVKDLLSKSAHPDIQLLFDIYKKYRYNSAPYYLLPYITDKTLTPEQAIEISKNETALIKHLLQLVINNEELAYVSVQQRWSELIDTYIKKIKQFRYRQPKDWNMEALDSLNTKNLTEILFTSSSMLNAQEQASFIQWILFKNGTNPIDINILKGIPLSYVTDQYVRIKHEKTEQNWASFIKAETLEHYILQKQEELANLEKEKQKENEKKGVNEVNLKKEVSGILSLKQSGSVLKNKKTESPVVITPKYVLKKYYFSLSENDKNLIKWKNDPLTALKNVTDWIDAPYSKELLIYISEKYPLEIVRNIDKIKLKKQGIEALQNIAQTAPFSAKNFIITPSHPWNYLFQNSKDSIIRTLYRINQIAGVNSRAYLLLDDIYHHRLSIEDADKLCQNSRNLTKRMIKLLSNPNTMGRYSLEQETEARSLKFVRNLNISINTNSLYAESLNELSPEEIYTFMTYGEDEIIQRSFDKMLHSLLNKIPNRNIYSLMEKLGFNQYTKLLQKAAYYDMMGILMQPLTYDQKKQLGKKLMSHIELRDMDEIIQIAGLIISLNNTEMVELLHQNLKEEYERVETAKSDKGVAAYGILSALISGKTQPDTWAKSAAQRYTLPDFEFLPVYSLFNGQMTNIQQYFFYNDADGISSFKNFIRSYERSPLEWLIKDLGNFVMIESRTGRKVQIFANKASSGELGVKAMLEYMSVNKLEPQVVVHRGLSTHTLNTFTRIPSSAKLILDGSCGGYYVQQVAIDRAPDAQILCNRNIGTMHINDPLFKQISDEIRSGKDIIWPELWTKMDVRVGSNPYFKDYIPPHKNAATILIKTLYELLEIH